MTIDLELATNADIMAELEKRECGSAHTIFCTPDDGLLVGNDVSPEVLARLGMILLAIAAGDTQAAEHED